MQLIIEKDLKYHGKLIDYWKAFDIYTMEQWTYKCPKTVQYIDIEEHNK